MCHNRSMIRGSTRKNNNKKEWKSTFLGFELNCILKAGTNPAHAELTVLAGRILDQK